MKLNIRYTIDGVYRAEVYFFSISEEYFFLAEDYKRELNNTKAIVFKSKGAIFFQFFFLFDFYYYSLEIFPFGNVCVLFSCGDFYILYKQIICIPPTKIRSHILVMKLIHLTVYNLYAK